MKIKFNFSINLLNIKEYKEAVNFFTLEKFRLSEEFFKRCLFMIQRKNLINSPTHIHILKK